MIAIPLMREGAAGYPIEVPCWNRTKDTARVAMFWCPEGHCGFLADHKVADDGVVTPSVVCPRSGCEFRDFVRLMDWKVAA